ncbi:MAG: MarR family transcriptional regulator [Rhodobacteraceae bacterium]|nr:MarR family transcriptional regulator [Paracoccaceae bacterium]
MTEPYDLHAAIGYQITLFSRINERRFEQGLNALGLTRVTWCILLSAGQQGLANPSDIAAFIGIDRTATSRGLKRLEADRLITRASGDADRRTTEVALTEHGKAILQRANECASENAEYFNSKLSWYERDMLTTILAKLLAGETRDVKGL